MGLHNLNQIYEEIKDDTWHLVNLYRSVKAAGMGAPHVLRLLKVANNDLASIESTYEILKQEVNSLKEQKRNLYNQVTIESSNLEYYRVACRREIANFEDLQLRKRKAEALAIRFENNNPEYVKIRKTVEEKVLAALSNGKALLKLALFCLIESIKENPDKYGKLIYENMPITACNYIPNYPFSTYDRQQYQPSYFDTKSMLVEEAEKMYDKLAKDLVDEVLSDYTVSSKRPSLPYNQGRPEEE